MTMEDLRDWVLQRFTPAVMVVSSPAAEALCQDENGLTVVDLLRPYGFLHQLSGELQCSGTPCPLALSHDSLFGCAHACTVSCRRVTGVSGIIMSSKVLACTPCQSECRDSCISWWRCSAGADRGRARLQDTGVQGPVLSGGHDVPAGAGGAACACMDDVNKT